MAGYRFALPDLGEGIAEGTIVCWHVAAGQTVAEGDPLVDVETDKAVVEIPSPATGRVGRLEFPEGAAVPVGALLVEIEAVEGPDGVEAALPPEPGPRVERPPGSAPTEDAARDRSGEPVPVRGVRARAAERLARVQREVPAVTVVEECDFTALDAELDGAERTAYLLAAASSALADVPELNATFADGAIAVHDRHDLGLAVQTADGLVVPVVRDVDRRSLDELATEIARLTDGARERRVAPAELTGSTFTVTEAGHLGGLFATPLVNAPEVAVLGLHRVAERPVARDGEVVVRRMGNVSCTFDHRAVEGFHASAFLLRFIELVERHGGLPAGPGPGDAPGPRPVRELAGAADDERTRAALELVRAEAAGLLGDGTRIDPRRTFKDLGFDSRMAVELRNRLARASGLRLPSTLLFDEPTPAAVAERLAGEALGRPRPRSRPARPPRRAGSGEPIAIVGMGCRYPGGVTTPQDLWDLVASGTDAITPFPTDRGWDLDGLFDPDPDHSGSSYARAGGFLADAGDFDADFFGIAPREALAMDPQQRLLLETAWEALEDACIDPGSLRGSATGVFAGVVANGYGLGDARARELEGYRLTGSTTSVASGRVAYALGLEGPAVTVDTACSSSLVAIHLACQALRAGECSLALAGGAAVMATPQLFLEFSRQRGLAPDGRCKSFAAAADGTAWSEGAGVVLLERLEDAVRRGHPVQAVVRASAINQDGESNGLTAPSGPAQERAIAQALANAGLDASDVDAVEAHGTGTTLGDPIEAGALLATYGQTERDEPLWLGSIKSNIGHASAAAGIAGVIKTVLALRNGRLPPTLHVDAPTPRADWSAGRVALLTEARDWLRGTRPRRAGVSSFGISGTNAHAIIEEAPSGKPERDGHDRHTHAPAFAQPPLLLPLSAKSEPALRAAARQLAAHIAGRPDLALVDVAFTLATGRAHFDHRAVVMGESREQLLAALTALAAGDDSPDVVRAAGLADSRPVFVFPGQGGQWPLMAVELLDASPAFAHHLEACERALAPFVEWSLKEQLSDPGAGWLDRVDIVQPALFAVSVALAGVWSDMGVEPAAVVGHSQGEIAAAYVAGGLSLEDAARVVALRARALARIVGHGSMAAISLPEAELRERLAPFDGQVSVAARNGPRQQVVAGDADAIERLLAGCAKDRVRAQAIAVDYAAHTAHVDALRDELLAAFTPVVPRSGRIPFHSTVAGEPLDTATLDGDYWYRNVREPVLLQPALESLLAAGRRSFLEVGAHPMLALAIAEAASGAGDTDGDATVLATLRRDAGGASELARALAEAHVAGVDVDWATLWDGFGVLQVPLPSYPFQRRRFWVDSAPRPAGAAAGQRAGGLASHPLLDDVTELADGGWLLTGQIAVDDHPWLTDHVIGNAALMPATASLELALQAGTIANAPRVAELVLDAPLPLPDRGAVELQVGIDAADDAGERPIEISARASSAGASWTRHATGRLAPARVPGPPLAPGGSPPAEADPVDVAWLYRRLADAGYDYGPAFQLLTAAWRLGDEILAEAAIEDPGRSDDAFAIDPALLDAVLQPSLLGALEAGHGETPWIPFAWTDVELHGRGSQALRARTTSVAEGAIQATIWDAAGAPVARVGGLSVRPAKLAGREIVRLVASHEVGASPAVDARATTLAALVRLQRLVAAPSSPSPHTLVTKRAVAAAEDDPVDLAAAPLWGLARSLQAELPGDFVLVDVDGTDASETTLTATPASGRQRVALRAGQAVEPCRGVTDGGLTIPPGVPWRLVASLDHPTEQLAFEHGASPPALGPNEVRVSIRAAGLGFRDVMVALGFDLPGAGLLGTEGAGVVADVGSDVTDLAPGDRVLGLIHGSFASLASADRRLLTMIPDGWSFATAAAVPGAFVTARLALVDFAQLAAGQRVLIHAGAGGVGLAAVQIAHKLGAEVFATASPSKWPALIEAGVSADHLASSRSVEFADAFLELTEGAGMDAIVNSLAHEAIDASLRLLPRGGRFVELGKTDLRDPATVAAEYHGVTYGALDLFQADGGRLQELLVESVEALERGELDPLPAKNVRVEQAASAFDLLRRGANVGKLVLGVPRPPTAQDTVLVTGAFGGLGAIVTRHLVERHGARRLLLVSRRGEAAEEASALRADLERLGAHVEVAACDVADRERLAALLGALPESHPLGTVVHAAGVLEDALVESLDAERIERVFAAKVEGAWNLHELTERLDLSRFVLFSSVAGVEGSAGQASYAAANSFLDALARERQRAGLPATSVAWGLWRRPTGMTANLSAAQVERASAVGGKPLTDEQALSLLDSALVTPSPVFAAYSADPGASTAKRAATDDARMRERLVPMTTEQRRHAMLELILNETARATGAGSASAVPRDRTFKQLGLDSLAALRLRNRLASTLGLSLAPTLAFDHGSPAELAEFLLDRAAGQDRDD